MFAQRIRSANPASIAVNLSRAVRPLAAVPRATPVAANNTLGRWVRYHASQAAQPAEKATPAASAAAPEMPRTLPKPGEWLDPFGVPMWTEEEVNSVKVLHRPTVDLTDKIAKAGVLLCRMAFDKLSGFKVGHMTERKWLLRMCFLETVAALPGFMGGMVRHLSSLRNMRRDNGFINCLLAEASNERVHLLCAVAMLEPSLLFRAGVVVTQGVLANVWFLAYMIHPKICHRFVGYLEEEAVHTYTLMLEDIDRGVVFKNTPAPDIAKAYWQLGEDATFRDMILAVRADEAHHRDANHVLADLPKGAKNPFVFPKHLKHFTHVTPGEAQEAQAAQADLRAKHESKSVAGSGL